MKTKTKEKISKHTFNLLTSILYTFIILGSFAVGFVAFVLVIAAIGTCYHIVGAGNFITWGQSWVYILGAIVILIVVYLKTSTYLFDYVKCYKKEKDDEK